jgi:hypothetical protein
MNHTHISIARGILSHLVVGKTCRKYHTLYEAYAAIFILSLPPRGFATDIMSLGA